MAEDLGARLVRAGLISREQLAAILGADPTTGGALAARLVEEGVVGQDALAQLLLADGHGPLQDALDLGRASPEVTGRIPPAMARALMALPLRVRDDAVIVAMADPSDRHAVVELERHLGQRVIPSTARAGDLRAALALVYPAPADEAAPRPQTEPPPPAAASPRSEDEPSEDEVAVPLVRPKPFAAPVRRTFRRPSPAARPPRTAPPPPRATPPPARATTATARPRSILPPAEDSWADLPPPSSSAPPPSPDRTPALGATLAALRAASDRDAILALACEGGLALARTAVFLALRDTTLRGWTGRGPGIVPDALRNLWIPSTSPSMFREVLTSGEPHFGPYGTSAADRLFRAAIGSRGGSVAIHPVNVSHRTVGLLCADDVPAAAASRLEELAHATGAALRRLILESR